MFKRIIVLLAFCLPLLVVAHASGAPLVSYTVTGSSNNWILDFSVTNTLEGANGIYFFGVDLPHTNSPATPAGWHWWSNPASTWNNYVLGGSNITYVMNWAADYANGGDATSIFNGRTLSGFEALVTTAEAPTSVNWFAFATYFSHPYYNGTDAFSGNVRGPGQFDFDNPGFEGIAHQIPEPATLSLLALGGLALIRRKRM